MRYFLLIACALTLLSCKKETDLEKIHQVYYKVVETSEDVPLYTVSYLDDYGATIKVEDLERDTWTSEILTQFRAGEMVTLTVESSAPEGEFRLMIYNNFELVKEEKMVLPSGKVTVSARLPD